MWILLAFNQHSCMRIVLSGRAAEKFNKAFGDNCGRCSGDFTTWKSRSLAVNATDKAFIDKLPESHRVTERKVFDLRNARLASKDSISFYTSGKKPLDTIDVGGERTRILYLLR